MQDCQSCHGFVVSKQTNWVPEDSTHLTEEEGKETFYVCPPVTDFAASAEAGCPTCRLIHDGIEAFYPGLLRDLAQETPAAGGVDSDEEGASVTIESQIGGPMTASVYNLPARYGRLQPLLEVFVLPDEVPPYPIIGAAAEVAESLDWQRCVHLARSCMSECKEKHPLCRVVGSNQLPTRVVDIGPPDGPIKVSLHVSDPQERADYVALSYCWGKSGNLTTTTNILEQRKRGIDWCALPKSFQDSALIVRGMGMRYLWIDALCIIQDDAEDWERESSQMAAIYENAVFTIATASSPNPTRGCLGARDGSSFESSASGGVQKKVRAGGGATRMVTLKGLGDGIVTEVRVREPFSHGEFVIHQPHYDLSYPLMSRAWATQERLLSPRLVHLTAAELVWECKTTLMCECRGIANEFLVGFDDWRGPKVQWERDVVKAQGTMADVLEIEGGADRVLPAHKDMASLWTKVISAFTFRGITFESDKLPALSGLAKRVQASAGLKTYLAGVWLEDLPWLLCWRAWGKTSRGRPETYCGPTWSWVSVRSQVLWDDVVWRCERTVRIVEAATTLQGMDVTGRVRDGYIVLSGRARVATLEERVADGLGSAVLKNDRGAVIHFWLDIGVEKTLSTEGGNISASTASVSQGHEVVCLELLRNERTEDILALVLVPKDKHLQAGPRSADVVYQRIGLVSTTRTVWTGQKDRVWEWMQGTTQQRDVRIE